MESKSSLYIPIDFKFLQVRISIEIRRDQTLGIFLEKIGIMAAFSIMENEDCLFIYAQNQCI
jgi:hypothetical protein